MRVSDAESEEPSRRDCRRVLLAASLSVSNSENGSILMANSATDSLAEFSSRSLSVVGVFSAPIQPDLMVSDSSVLYSGSALIIAEGVSLSVIGSGVIFGGVSWFAIGSLAL